ncbi:hypothetical protein L9F63_017508, partial [Diploptera punctata]
SHHSYCAHHPMKRNSYFLWNGLSALRQPPGHGEISPHQRNEMLGGLTPHSLRISTSAHMTQQGSHVAPCNRQLYKFIMMTNVCRMNFSFGIFWPVLA